MRLFDADKLMYRIALDADDKMVAYVTGQDIDSAPTIDAAPVVHGRWEIAIGYDPKKSCQCQICYLMSFEPTKYCPNCGAKMDAEEVE